MTNTALIEARRRAGLSQYTLAREIRRFGFTTGNPNGCTREMVARWDRGKVRRPQPQYLTALEHILGMPVASLGFDADLHYDVDRPRVLSESGLDAPFRLPDPAGSYGPMSGVWLSSYRYASSGRGREYVSRHYVVLLQTGGRLMIRSVPASASELSMSLSLNGRIVTGTWTERTRPDGYYRAATYHGAIQLIAAEDERRMDGKWIGFGKGGEINDGGWAMELTEPSLSPEAVSRWDLPLD